MGEHITEDMPAVGPVGEAPGSIHDQLDESDDDFQYEEVEVVR